MVLRSYRFRIYPSRSQRSTLEQTFSSCCTLWNDANHERKDAFKKSETYLSYFDQCKYLPEIKEIESSLNLVHSQVLQAVLKRLNIAYQASYKRIKLGKEPGFPRFR